ncbi:MAG: mechanosensitive ion channel [Kiritimatiellae bacterium]|nr:mechanosensitive ion channel [Kiritimatiellia bacterium]
MEQLVQKLQEWVAAYGLRVVGAVAILVVGRWVTMGIRAVLRKLMEKSKVESTLVSFVCSLAYVGMLTFLLIAALGILNIPTASFVAVLGAAGLAVGLALQGSLSNFAAGVLMIIFKPFRVGDFVEGAGTAGVVEEIGIFTTRIKSPDNKEIIVPNAKLTGDNIVNYTAKDCRRVDLVAGVSYNDNLDKVRDTLNAVLKEDARVLSEPAPTVAVLELADSSVNWAVRPWVKTGDYWDVFFDLQKKIKERFDAEGISIPFPQHDVHIIKDA